MEEGRRRRGGYVSMFSFSREQGEETGRKMENLLILMLFGRKGKACLSVYLPVCLSLRYLAALMLRGFSSALSLSLSLYETRPLSVSSGPSLQ